MLCNSSTKIETKRKALIISPPTCFYFNFKNDYIKKKKSFINFFFSKRAKNRVRWNELLVDVHVMRVTIMLPAEGGRAARERAVKRGGLPALEFQVASKTAFNSISPATIANIRTRVVTFLRDRSGPSFFPHFTFYKLKKKTVKRKKTNSIRSFPLLIRLFFSIMKTFDRAYGGREGRPVVSQVVALQRVLSVKRGVAVGQRAVERRLFAAFEPHVTQ